MPLLTPKRKIALWIVAGLFVIYSLAGFVAAPMVIRHILEKTVPSIIHRQVTVDAVRVNPYTLSVVLFGLTVSDETATTLVNLDQIRVNAQISSLFRRALVLKSVSLDRPDVNLVRTASLRFNFSDLIQRPADTPQPPAAEPGAPLRVVLGHLQINGGRLRFEDRSLEKAFSTTLSAINLTVSSLDTAPKAPPGAVALAFKTEAEERIDFKGRLAPTPLDATVEVHGRAIDLVKYAPYYQPYWHGRLTSGLMDLSAVGHWSANTGGLDSIMFKLADLKAVHDNTGDPLLNVPLFQIRNARIDLGAHSMDLGMVSASDGTAWIRRLADGRMDLTTAFAGGSSPQATTTSTTPAHTAGPGDGTRMPASHWTLTLPALAIHNYRLEIEDRVPGKPAHMALSQINIEAHALGTEPGKTGNLSMTLNWSDQGSVNINGQVGLVPLQADLSIAADNLDIRPLQPYVDEYAGLLITSGHFNAQGTLKAKIDAASAPDIRFAGQVSLGNFKSVDMAQKAELFNFKSLYLKGIEARIQPLQLTINEVSMTDFYNKVLIAADGSSNIGAILKKNKPETNANTSRPAVPTKKDNPPKAASPNQPQGTAPDIQIKTVTLQGGAIDFSDLSVDPSVRLPMTKVGGRISGLDAIRENKADVLLEGMVHGTEPIKISGKINPLIKPPFLDLQLHLTSMDLSPFTPYAEKYLGYELEKGQLSMNLSYVIENNKLQGKNNAVLNQLTLGRSVPSTSATKLPIKLAIALLKDRKGNIDIDLPVKGDLDNPQFSISGIVLKMLGKLVLDIVTSPFKILGALFGGGEELSHIDFAAGQADLTPQNKTRLDDLAKILFERPAVNLEIQGRFDAKEDSNGLREARFEHQLKVAKLKSMLAAGQHAIPLDEISITDQEREQIVRQAYADADFPKPLDEKGREKVLPPEEMEKMLHTAIEITDDDLRQLAQQRALAAKDYLLQTGKVDAGRLFLLDVEAGQSRVQFSLK